MPQLAGRGRSHRRRQPVRRARGPVDDKDPSRYVVTVSQSGLAMPDRDYYLKTEDTFVKYRDGYRAHIARMFDPRRRNRRRCARGKGAGVRNRARQGTLDPRQDSRDADKTYNMMTFAELERGDAGLRLAAAFFGAIGVAPQQLIVSQPSAIKASAALVAATPVEVLRDAVLMRTLSTLRQLSAQGVRRREFRLLRHDPVGHAAAARPLEARGELTSPACSARMSASSMSSATSRPKPRRRRTIWSRTSSRRWTAASHGLTWMAPETKVKARAKLAAFTPKIGYPDKWRDYSALEIKPRRRARQRHARAPSSNMIAT